MKNSIITLILLVFLFPALSAADNGKYEITYGDTVRTYLMFVPQSGNPGMPLVVCAHGYGSKTRWRKDLVKVADSCGFAVCFPDGAPDSRGKDGWYVGYPPQQGYMDTDEGAFFSALVDEVCTRFNLSHTNVFLAGMSNGGDLCYQLAFTNPGLFKAFGSVAGLMFKWVYEAYPLPRAVPFLEIHGDADKTSIWEGDLSNQGGWGAYLPVEWAAFTMAVANRCTTSTVDSLGVLKPGGGEVTLIRYEGAPSGADVYLYRISGGPHSWGQKSVPTAELLWNFFSRYIDK